MQYWLMKSEPNVFSIDDLKAAPKQTEHWDGVRNYQARNFMRDQMNLGDQVFFYHSNCQQPGIVGICEVASAPYPDHTALDPSSPYFDEKSRIDRIRWEMVDVKFVEKFTRTITLQELKDLKNLEDFALVRKGNRLSIMPVSAKQFSFILSLLN